MAHLQKLDDLANFWVSGEKSAAAALPSEQGKFVQVHENRGHRGAPGHSRRLSPDLLPGVLANEDARLGQKLLRQLVGVRILVDDLGNTGVDEHLGAHHAGLRVHVDGGTGDVDAVAGRLDDGVLLGVQTAADLVTLAARHAQLLAQTSGLTAVGKAGGHARCSPWPGCGDPSR